MPKEIKPRRVTIVRYVDVNGRRCDRKTPGAKKVKEKSDTYYATVPIDGKPTRVSLETSDEGQAWIRLRQLQREARLAAAGISDDFLEHAEAPWSTHVDAWLSVVRARNVSEDQVAVLAAHVETLRQLAGWSRITDVSSSSAQAVLGQLQHKLGRSAQTRNHYLSHLRQFVRWLVADGRLRSNPILTVEPVNVEEDRRHDRRSPTDDEIAKLLAYLHSDRARVRKDMPGPQRALGYQVSMATGYRAKELRSLDRGNFDLEAGTVTVVAGYSKRRRTDVQHLPAWLIEKLREWFAAGGGTWTNFPKKHPGRVLKADLKAAGVEYKIKGLSGPLFFDFHSLRVWYCSAIANSAGISPKVMMELCRHSTPALTMKVYAKVNVTEARRVVSELPDVSKLGLPPASSPDQKQPEPPTA